MMRGIFMGRGLERLQGGAGEAAGRGCGGAAAYGKPGMRGEQGSGELERRGAGRGCREGLERLRGRGCGGAAAYGTGLRG